MTEQPRLLFQQIHKDAAEALAALSKDRPLRVAIPFAIAEMVFMNAPKEQLDGAKRFAQILMTLGDKPDSPTPYPDKSLKSS